MSNPLPLFLAYPGLANLPHIDLGLFPTPIQEIPGFEQFRNRIYVKRDDLSGRVYGGNKVRKLEFALGEAKSMAAEEVLTFGCDGSNHALATGIYSGLLGMRGISILRTQLSTHYLRKNLLKSMYYGIELHHVENKAEMDALTETIIQERRDAGRKTPYIVPVGGSSPLGTVGFVNAAFELAQQVSDNLLPEPDYVYAAAGTNGTVCGLMIGFKALGMKTKVIPVQVNDVERVNPSAISKLVDDTVTLMRKYDPSFPAVHFEPEEVPLVDTYFGGTYALFTEKGMTALDRIREETGLQLEGTYTGKTLAALLDAVQGKLTGKTVVFWNTLNSRECPVDVLKELDYHQLPEGFHSYFENDVQPLDR